MQNIVYQTGKYNPIAHGIAIAQAKALDILVGSHPVPNATGNLPQTHEEKMFLAQAAAALNGRK